MAHTAPSCLQRIRKDRFEAYLDSGLLFKPRLNLAGWVLARYSLVMPVDYQRFIERRREICGGEAVIKGTRVTVRTVLASLAEGATVEEIVADFPAVSREAVQAMIAFAAASAEEDLP